MIINTVATVILLAVLLLGGKLFYSSYKNNPKRKYKDIIVYDIKEADYYIGKKGEEFTPEIKKQIYARDKGICQHSRKKTKNAPVGIWQKLRYTASFIPGFGWLWRDWLCEIDHKIFRSFGGKNTVQNGRCLAQRFNRRRSNNPDRVFFEAIREEKAKVYLGKKR